MNFDYESVLNRLVVALQGKSSWAAILPTSTNMRLLSIIANGISELAQYDEYLTKETKWNLAENYASLSSGANLLGYTPARKISASGSLRLSAASSFDTPPGDTIPIPAYSQFSNGVSTYVCTIESNNITTSDNYIDVEVIEGIPVTLNFTATGATYEEFDVVDNSVENSHFTLTVNGTAWTYVTDLRLYQYDDEVYTIKNLPDYTGIRIIFGNAIFGKKLTVGDTIAFTYVQSSGSLGEILSTGVITVTESTFSEDVYCTNPSTITGGADIEDIESIRSLAPLLFETGYRASTKADYKAILENHALIEKATVWGAYEYNIDNGDDPNTFIDTEENVVHIAAYTPSGNQLTSGNKTTLIEYLADYKSPTDIPDFTDVGFINLSFTVNAYVSNRGLSLATIQSAITTALSSQYALGQLDFKDTLYYSDYIAFLDGISGVEYHLTDLNLLLEPTFSGPYVAAMNFPFTTLEESSISIYTDNAGGGTYTLIGTDDGLGGFNSEAGYDLTGSSINYSTGVGVLNVASGLAGTYSDYNIKVYYQLPNQKNIVPEQRYQIIRYRESTVNVAYTTI